MDHQVLFVVGDEEPVREALSRVLRVLGCRVFAFGTAEGALAKLEELLPDVVISNNSLAVTTGVELMRRIRAEHPRVRTVMVTGATPGPGALEAAGGGVADRLLTKPWKDSELRGVIRELLLDR